MAPALPFRRRLAVAAVAAVAIGLAPTLVFADHAAPTAAEIKAAAEEYDTAVRAAKSKDFEAAAVHFEAADREAPSAGALAGAIKSRRDANQLDRAATLAELALVRYPDEKGLGDLARGVLDKTAATLQKVTLSCSPACVVVVDQRLLTGDPLTKITVHFAPGDHTIAAGWGKRNVSKTIAAKAGASQDLALKEPPPEVPVASATPSASAPVLADSAAPVTSAAPSSGGLPPAVFIAGSIITAGLLGVTIWSGVDTNNNPGPSKVKQECVGLGEGCKAYQDGLSRQKRTNLLLGGTIGAGVITAVIGVALTNWHGSQPEPQAGRVVPLLDVGSRGFSMGAHLAF